MAPSAPMNRGTAPGTARCLRPTWRGFTIPPAAAAPCPVAVPAGGNQAPSENKEYVVIFRRPARGWDTGHAGSWAGPAGADVPPRGTRTVGAAGPREGKE